MEAFDPPIFASLCSPNLNTAVTRLAQHTRLIGPMVLTVNIDKHQTSVAIDCYGHEGQIPRSLGAAELVFFTALARLATRQRIVPTKVGLAQPPENPKPFEAYFGTRIRTGEANRIAFSAPDANRPFLTADAAMWEFFEAGLRKRLSDLGGEASSLPKAHCVDALLHATSDISAITPGALRRFVAAQSEHFSAPHGAATLIPALREYLRFRATCGDQVQALIAVLRRPRNWRQAPKQASSGVGIGTSNSLELRIDAAM